MNLLALLLTLAVAVSCTLLSVATRRAGRRGIESAGYVLDLSEVAFLSGGPARVVDTALTRMHTDGRLTIGGPGIVALQRAEARDAVERAVLQELATAPDGALNTLREAVMRHPAVQEIGDGLAGRGLLIAPGESRDRRRWGLALGIGSLVCLPLSIPLTVAQYVLMDEYADAPVPFVVKVLPAIIAGSVVGLSTASAAKARITTAGRRVCDSFRIANAHVADPAHLVATQGLRALPDPDLQGQLAGAARQRSSRHSLSGSTASPAAANAFVPVIWCASVGPDRGSCGGSSGGGGHSGPGSTCSSGSSCSSGSGCGSGGGSSCSSGSSCGSSGGSSCGGGGGSSCGSSS
ncbi:MULTISPECIES: TIGR04222 domain-containing membrane protein [unclassified Streptomyces]|uniref:TIGR04222 domain-containing membrane protein n=1 Tax=unclassified Streptomyces TaxID=2593676 RepID=UPI000CD4A5F7|nr:TIGR04222 domain-containing membrane protein [Streptomyces sp. SM10]